MEIIQLFFKEEGGLENLVPPLYFQSFIFTKATSRGNPSALTIFGLNSKSSVVVLKKWHILTTPFSLSLFLRDLDIVYGLDWGSVQVNLGKTLALAQVSSLDLVGFVISWGSSNNHSSLSPRFKHFI